MYITDERGTVMNRSLRNMIALGAILLTAMLNNCGGGGGGGGSGSGSLDNGGGAASAQLSTFTNDVSACMPVLGASSPDPGEAGLGEWSAWDPMASGTVLGKLFDPGIGGNECFSAQVELLDSHIAMAQEFADTWDTSGTYTRGNITAIVQTDVPAVTIPYLAFDIPVERLITLQVPDEDLTIHMAFTLDGDDQTIVEQYEIGDTQAGVFYSWKEGNEAGIWHASIGESKVQFMWQGDSLDKSFIITECTDAAGGNWEVMGGGSVASSASEMAFMARNQDNNASSDAYYLAISLADLMDGTPQPIWNAGTNPPDPGTNAVLAYVTEEDINCFGFLGNREYPADLTELAWNQ